MTEHSAEIAELAAALSAAQAEFSAIPKGSDNDFFKSKYADLADVIKGAAPVASKHGLSVTQWIGFDDKGEPDAIEGAAAKGVVDAAERDGRLVVAARPFVPASAQAPASFGTLQSIGAQLYTQWLAPFEAVSLLLLVAMVGAVVVAKSRV